LTVVKESIYYYVGDWSVVEGETRTPRAERTRGGRRVSLALVGGVPLEEGGGLHKRFPAKITNPQGSLFNDEIYELNIRNILSHTKLS